MRRLRWLFVAATFAAAAAVVASAPFAAASPPSPVPLERRIADSDVIFVGTLKSQPVHCGDAYDVTVEEMLKGASLTLAQIRVTAPWVYDGGVEFEGKPKPKAPEAGARRAIWFCDAAKDGVRGSIAVVTLDPDEGMPASFWIGIFAKYRASHGPEAIKALVALDDPRVGAEEGARLWIKGLASGNPILVEALLDRYEATFAGDPPQSGSVGGRFREDLVRRALRDAAAAPADLLAAVLAHTADKLPPHRSRAMGCAAEAYPRAAVADRPRFADAIAQARASLDDADTDIRRASLWLVVVTEDRDAVAALTDALTRRDAEPYDYTLGRDLALSLAKTSDARKEEVTEMFVFLLDAREDGRTWQMDALRKLTGQTFTDAAAWKSWWKSRKK